MGDNFYKMSKYQFYLCGAKLRNNELNILEKVSKSILLMIKEEQWPQSKVKS